MAGKGSKQRPLSIPKEKFDQNWDAIFGKKDQKKPVDTQKENK